MSIPRHNIAIIGGGAAGLMCALKITDFGCGCVVFEKNKSNKILESEAFFDNAYLGKKLLITGKGRCNITNMCDAETFLKNVPVNSKFLYASVNSFTPADTVEFFESLGLATKIERGNRVFPVSDRSLDVLNTIKRTMKKRDITVLNENISDITLSENGEYILVNSEGKKYTFKKVVICTGGISYPQTGSTGDGYEFAKKFGHTVITPKPSLVPIMTKEEWCCELQGLALKNVRLSLKKNKKTVFSEIGEMLFTHFGVSGPLVLSASAHIRGNLDDYSFLLDLKPGLDEDKLDKRILSDFAKYNNQNFNNSLKDLLPGRIINTLRNVCDIPYDTKANSISKEMRNRLKSNIKNLVFHPMAFRPVDEAIITSGGIKVSEINPSTMESKLVKNLFFAGEIIDVDAYTGGFNLQIAFSTAYLAAKGCTNETE